MFCRKILFLWLPVSLTFRSFSMNNEPNYVKMRGSLNPIGINYFCNSVVSAVQNCIGCTWLREVYSRFENSIKFVLETNRSVLENPNVVNREFKKSVEISGGSVSIVSKNPGGTLLDVSVNFNNSSYLKRSIFGYFLSKSYVSLKDMFNRCTTIKTIRNFAIGRYIVPTNTSCMFYKCSSLVNLHNMSNWDTGNVTDMCNMFCLCSSLSKLPDISNWDTGKVKSFVGMFASCSSLNRLPDISKWNTCNVTDMTCMFFGCYSLDVLPDISKWNTHNLLDFGFIFSLCSSLTTIPDITKWNNANRVNSFSLEGCYSLIILPDLDGFNVNHDSCLNLQRQVFLPN